MEFGPFVMYVKNGPGLGAIATIILALIRIITVFTG
jgi:hypothetical protein